MRNNEREEQWRETLEVATGLRNRAAAEVRADPRPGELYVSRRTADFPVEWLVLASADRGRLWVAPVDDYPLVGSQDVELPAAELCGVAVVRCGLTTRVGRSALAGETRTAMLPAEVLEEVCEKRRAVDDGVVEPTLLEGVADGDLEYQEWAEGTLRAAVTALEGSASVVPLWTRRVVKSVRSWGPLVAVPVAVAAMLVMVLGLGQMVWRLQGELDLARDRVAVLEEEGGEQRARLEEEVRLRSVSEGEVGRLAGLLGAAEKTLTEKRAQLDALHGQLMDALDFGVVKNPRKLMFRGARRNFPQVIQQGASPLVIVEVEVVDPEPYLTYRLRLKPLKGGEALDFEGLRREGSWLRVVLQDGELPVGEYEVLVDGMGFGKPKELDKFRMTVEP